MQILSTSRFLSKKNEKNLIFLWRNIVLIKKMINFALAIVQWCNGSTSDSGSACEGSNPSWTTKASCKPTIIF